MQGDWVGVAIHSWSLLLFKEEEKKESSLNCSTRLLMLLVNGLQTQVPSPMLIRPISAFTLVGILRAVMYPVSRTLSMWRYTSKGLTLLHLLFPNHNLLSEIISINTKSRKGCILWEYVNCYKNQGCKMNIQTTNHRKILLSPKRKLKQTCFCCHMRSNTV